METTKNRWLIVASAVGIHISIGSVYAYSVMTKPVASVLNLDDPTKVKTAFMIAIFFLGIAAAFLGKMVEKIGPKNSGIATAILYGLGTIGSGVAIQMESLNLFYACYGVIGGIGLGIGYITPVSTLVKWFPDKRGMATGMAIMGFGFASMVFGPLMADLFIDSMLGDKEVYTIASVSKTFYIVGTIYFVLIFGSSLYMAKPPEGWLPANMQEGAKKPKTVRQDLANLDSNEALKTFRFYLIWLMMFINISCGIALIASASPLLQDIYKISAVQAGAIVGLLGVFNGIGRFFWSGLSDYLGRSRTYVIFFALQIVTFYAMPHLPSVGTFQILFYLIMTCYGGAFAVLPAFLGDLFGTKQLGAIHGRVLTAWACAGFAGPGLLTFLQKHFNGDYTKIFPVFVGCFVIALTASILMILNIKKLQSPQSSSTQPNLEPTS